MSSDPVMLQYLKSIQDSVTRIESKQDINTKAIASLNESRAEVKGMARLGSAISIVVAGLASWLFNHWPLK